MDENEPSWRASVEAEQGDDGLFCPVLAITQITADGEQATRVKLSGIYRTPEDAVAAGRETITAMALNG